MEKFIVAAISTRNLLGQPDASLANMHIWIEKAARQGAEFILFPELNVTGYIQNPVARQYAEPIPGPSTEKAIRLAHDMNVTLSCGILERAGEQFFCTHIILNGDGLIGKQRKIHTPSQEQPYWGAGDSIDVFDVGKAKVGITICRDSFFDEMTRTLYFKGAEMVLMPFGYYNVPRSRYLRESIHGMSIVKACWTNGYYALVCNSAENRATSEFEPQGNNFPGWAGVIDPWGSVLSFVDSEGNDEAMVVVEIGPERLQDRRNHPNFLARELRTGLYQFEYRSPSLDKKEQK
jgi:predicted amidohydrolase